MSANVTQSCLLCGTPPRPRPQPPGDVKDIDCSRCGQYFLSELDVTMCINEDPLQQPSQRSRLSALLFERKTTRPNALPPLLVFHPDERLPEVPYADPVRVIEFLATWPASVTDQLDRAICLLARIAPRAGEEIKPERNEPVPHPTWLLAEDWSQARYLQEHLLQLVWLERPTAVAGAKVVRLTPKGWARVAELTRTRSALENDVFVAMWFGELKKHDKDTADRTVEMRQLYAEAISPAIVKAGYREHRADSGDYNGENMDKVRYDIRRAPFVVADFTNHNRGVYYEAGLAAGHGIEVIHCCPDPEFEEAHFDIRHVNHIVYTSPDDLRKQLKGRILKSRGEGPFPPPGGVTWD